MNKRFLSSRTHLLFVAFEDDELDVLRLRRLR